MKRARLSDDVAGDIMFVRENIKVLNDHIESLTGRREELILPMIRNDDVYNEDVGQGDM